MERPTARLTLVAPPGVTSPRPRGAAPRDLGATALWVGVSLPPIVGELAHAGRWGAGSVGLATAIAMLAGSALWHEILDARRAR